jgi:hypothetical protein
MHFSLPLIVAAASLSTAAPLANTENIVLDKRADVGGVIAFQSGQWMSVVEIQKGINQWCSRKLLLYLCPSNQYILNYTVQK